ncbi:MAG: TlpA disulfide reductase family protein, partial [Acidobacteriota bacterium]
TLVTLGGETVEFESTLKPVTLVHFWATWCPPCITETPSIRRLATSLADEPRFSLLMVAVADDAEAAVEFLGDGTPTFFDPDWDVAHAFGTEKLPETFLMVDGEVAERFLGAQNWDDPALHQRVADALADVGSS